VTAPDLAVVLAGAGEGRRMGGSGPKLVLEIGGRTLLERVAATFLAHPAVGELVAAVPERLLERSRSILAGLPNPRGARVAAVAGGATRQESVRRGLEALERELPFVAVHDVARAMVTDALIGRVLDAARTTGAAIPALPLRDTVKEVQSGRVTRTVPRDRLQAAQTPQIFARDILARAHAVAAGADERAAATDDAALVEAVGAVVQVVPGEPTNWKLTDPSDVSLLASRLDAGESR
jgi:2-C-methyl-D-erythritol 4-phosphate cytidylyltransferase